MVVIMLGDLVNQLTTSYVGYQHQTLFYQEVQCPVDGRFCQPWQVLHYQLVYICGG
jgi:hypothetical protein